MTMHNYRPITIIIIMYFDCMKAAHEAMNVVAIVLL